jgi:ribonuclease Z
LNLGDGPLPDKVVVPQPKLPREDQQEQYTRDTEIDPHKYYPPDVARELLTKLPEDLAYTKEDLETMIAARPDSD